MSTSSTCYFCEQAASLSCPKCDVRICNSHQGEFFEAVPMGRSFLVVPHRAICSNCQLVGAHVSKAQKRITYCSVFGGCMSVFTFGISGVISYFSAKCVVAALSRTCQQLPLNIKSGDRYRSTWTVTDSWCSVYPLEMVFQK